MRRSEINHYIEHARTFFDEHQFILPPFALWTVKDWQHKGSEADEIRTRHLGWDLTSFGHRDFLKQGLLLFTLRNGCIGDPANHKTYAEKIMLVREDQVTPFHFHFHKTEDIINRGGGNLVCELYNSTPNGAFAQSEVTVSCDGVRCTLPPGGKIILEPGQSITMTPGLYHKFYAQTGGGIAMVGEVSSVNDDATDNRFFEPLPRFNTIEEDEPPVHLLCNEYPASNV